MSGYLLDNAWHEQRRRLAGLEAWFDPGTMRHLEALGVAPGWRCLEVGAGGGSIAAWLAARVGPGGHVLATDLDTRFVGELRYPTLEVRRHDLLADPLPPAAFDLVHARFVVEHLSDRATALRTMTNALKPGGWLLVEDTDSSSWIADPAQPPDRVALFRRWTQVYIQLCASAGADANAGRRLFSEFRALGLGEIGAEGRVYMVPGGSAPAEVWRLTAEQVRPVLEAAGLLTPDEMDRLLALMSNPDFVWMEGLVMAAWGQRMSSAEHVLILPSQLSRESRDQKGDLSRSDAPVHAPCSE